MVALGGLAVSDSACLAIVDTNADQCNTDADCTAKGDAFKSTICSPQKVCIVSHPRCQTSDECNAIPGYEYAVCTTKKFCAPPAESAECDTTAHCLAKPAAPGGAGTYCTKDRACAPMVNDQCKEFVTTDTSYTKLVPITDPDTIIIGAVQWLSGTSAAAGAERVNVAKLALKRAMSDLGGGIQIPNRNKAAPLALGICDQDGPSAGAFLEPSINHLIDIGAPAIIGPAQSGPALATAKADFVPRKTIQMQPGAEVNLGPENPPGQPALLWNTAVSYAPQAIAFTKLVADMEKDPAIRAELGLGATDKIRVAAIVKADARGNDFTQLVEQNLKINGGDITTNGDNYKRFNIPADTTQAVDVYKQAAAFAPHFLFNVTGVELYKAILQQIEDNWPAGKPRGYWFEGVAARTRENTDYVIESTKLNPERKLATRMRQLQGRDDPQQFVSFNSAWNTEYGKDVPAVLGLTGGYDGFMILALGSVATISAGQKVTGPNLAQGITKVVAHGDPALKNVQVFSNTFRDGVADLRAGKSIDLDGITGKLEFDTQKGTTQVQLQWACIETATATDGSGTITTKYNPLGLLFDTGTNTETQDPTKFKGLTCPVPKP
jgi:hypothetical protein